MKKNFGGGFSKNFQGKFSRKVAKKLNLRCLLMRAQKTFLYRPNLAKPKQIIFRKHEISFVLKAANARNLYDSKALKERWSQGSNLPKASISVTS